MNDLLKIDAETIGEEIYHLMEELYPICRSITGDGVRETLTILNRHIPLEIHEVPTGTQVFDWTVPKEWNIRDAYIRNSDGKKIVDFKKSNLHVLNYSIPIQRTMSLDELSSHLHTIPEQPDWIPYRTSYYQDAWGFCLTHNDFQQMKEGEYEVYIDSTLEDGQLTYGELLIKGQSEEEILISTHVCHPSMCNDNLSGIAVSMTLAKELMNADTRFSYRFLFIPGTIGAITWLALNEKNTGKIKNGLVLAGLGDSGQIVYKKSRDGDNEIDKAAAQMLKDSGEDHTILDFTPYGYDERQFCSPGFNLPLGRISRSVYGEYPEYHTSADNLDFVSRISLSDSYEKMINLFSILENNRMYVNLNPKCEPQLGKRGLYSNPGSDELAMLWVLNYSDGHHSLLDICELSNLSFTAISAAADSLKNHGLLIETLS